jgi:hypothetical protein
MAPRAPPSGVSDYDAVSPSGRAALSAENSASPR